MNRVLHTAIGSRAIESPHEMRTGTIFADDENVIYKKLCCWIYVLYVMHVLNVPCAVRYFGRFGPPTRAGSARSTWSFEEAI